MVAKKGSRIAQNPKSKLSTQAADEWITQGGIDPETTKPKSSTLPIQEPEDQIEKDDQTRKYPHRISFDMDKAQYKRLKWSSFDSERSMNEILREAVEEWMKARDY